MYIALVDEYPTLASKSLDPRREYCCPRCHERVALKTGLFVAPHFAHYPKSDCPRKGGGEGKEHASLKVQLHHFLLEEVASGRISYLRMEAPFGKMFSDLGFVTSQGINVAVEITVNNLNFAHTKEKIRAYRQMKVYPLWLFAHLALRPRSRKPLAPEQIIAAMQAETSDWVELDGPTESLGFSPIFTAFSHTLACSCPAGCLWRSGWSSPKEDLRGKSNTERYWYFRILAILSRWSSLSVYTRGEDSRNQLKHPWRRYHRISRTSGPRFLMEAIEGITAGERY